MRRTFQTGLSSLLVAAVALAAACGRDDGGGDEGDGLGGADGGDGDDDVLDRKYVFVTSGTFAGNFWFDAPSFPDSSGPAQADALCASAAAGGNLAGSWRAWLSTKARIEATYDVEAANAGDRLIDVGPWYLPGTDTLVFNNVDHIRNTPLVPINRNEHGVEVPAGNVWTGTLVGGTVGFDDCRQWHPDADTSGVVGDLTSSTSTWTDTNAGFGVGVGFRCVDRAHLYCIQQ